MSVVSLSQPAAAGESGVISPFLTLTATGIDRNTAGSNEEAQLSFWFSIPEGSLWGSPSWGHPFNSKLFMSGSENELVAAEMSIVRKLRYDMPELKINGIRATFQGSDLIVFTIFYLGGSGQSAFQGSVS